MFHLQYDTVEYSKKNALFILFFFGGGGDLLRCSIHCLFTAILFSSRNLLSERIFNVMHSHFCASIACLSGWTSGTFCILSTGLELICNVTLSKCKLIHNQEPFKPHKLPDP